MLFLQLIREHFKIFVEYRPKIYIYYNCTLHIHLSIFSVLSETVEIYSIKCWGNHCIHSVKLTNGNVQLV